MWRLTSASAKSGFLVQPGSTFGRWANTFLMVVFLCWLAQDDLWRRDNAAWGEAQLKLLCFQMLKLRRSRCPAFARELSTKSVAFEGYWIEQGHSSSGQALILIKFLVEILFCTPLNGVIQIYSSAMFTQTWKVTDAAIPEELHQAQFLTIIQKTKTCFSMMSWNRSFDWI